ncbi:hypothetical protein GPJ56_004427 [Histomonas meleagridis]|uniref:uncharacterized protein n=1 Tax=Histomonas meleagridis TaxID=135588 RepID=UPI00355A1343|nr:hypothetical protein GPJ56_004427 [Histomonas meleagridis]KAH0799928.1 hypothetical protein GO595_007040 [Histomonas meleagridis]
MPCKPSCCKNALIMLFSIIGVLLSLALMIVIVVKFGMIKDLYDNQTFFIILIVITCIGVFVLFMSISGGCAGSKGFRISVSVFLYIYGAIGAVFAILIYIYKGGFAQDVVTYLGIHFYNDKLTEAIEKAFGCCAILSLRTECLSLEAKRCVSSIPDDIEIFSYVSLGVFFAAFVLMIIAGVLLDCTSCG